ncbi:HNH endonuclease [Arthrobacter sp. zg-Y20]|uniref:HNH endonuclease signature motif containing protein n=1 Tax=Arthrobacter sp. zg-Y20 TaxID=2886938 RepID=UPI001D14EC39|nr:HNH endonuclease [Arthrobacter sp. zg-Y20]
MDWEYSGRPDSAEVDHIIPHAQGGPDTIENTRVICRQCNQRLGGRMNKRAPRPRVETKALPTAVDW